MILRYCTAQRSDDIVHERMSHACIARTYRPNAHNRPTCHPFDKQCRMAIIISGTVIWKARIYEQLATWRRCTFQHTNTRTVWSVLCPFNILPVQADGDGSGRGRASWLASTTMPFLCPRPALCLVYRGVQIVKVWSVLVYRVQLKIDVRRP